jgi:preprotein translocase subunit SecB
MSDTQSNGGADGTNGAPAINGLVQFVKDLSFENPNAPRSLGPQEKQPNISLQVNVGAQQISQSDYEVSLTVDVKAGENESLLFKLDLDYRGIFRMINIPADQIQPIILIECPRLLFPFVRQIVADATRDGGFPPLFIDPIDFISLYQQRMANGEANVARAN